MERFMQLPLLGQEQRPQNISVRQSNCECPQSSEQAELNSVRFSDKLAGRKIRSNKQIIGSEEDDRMDRRLSAPGIVKNACQTLIATAKRVES